MRTLERLNAQGECKTKWDLIEVAPACTGIQDLRISTFYNEVYLDYRLDDLRQDLWDSTRIDDLHYSNQSSQEIDDDSKPDSLDDPLADSDKSTEGPEENMSSSRASVCDFNDSLHCPLPMSPFEKSGLLEPEISSPLVDPSLATSVNSAYSDLVILQFRRHTH